MVWTQGKGTGRDAERSSYCIGGVVNERGDGIDVYFLSDARSLPSVVNNINISVVGIMAPDTTVCTSTPDPKPVRLL